MNILLQDAPPCIGCSSSCGTVTTTSGTLSDGSGYSKYGNRATCLWVLAPVNATNITITFNEFNTEMYVDVVQVYQCLSISNMRCEGAEMVRELSGSYSSFQTISLSTGYAMVQFMSDSSITYAGFTGSWTSNAPSPRTVSVFCIMSKSTDDPNTVW
jgi:hypothetical protein